MYFNKFPLTYYPIPDGGYKLATDIFRRAQFIGAAKDDRQTYIDYTIKDGERPEQIATRFYGSANLHWIILLMNDIINPYYDWPLDSNTLETFITNKYGAGFEDEVHHLVLPDGTSVDSPDYLVTNEGDPIVTDQAGKILINDINTLPGARIVTNRDYEIAINDAKREIRVLRPEYVTVAQRQLRTKLKPR